jgi:hypothetical protein
VARGGGVGVLLGRIRRAPAGRHTIVITAAAPDRTSFGCESGRDFTYFGEAFFRDALAKTASFTEAFEIARRIVTQREAAERLPASQPQISVGRSIAELLGRR